MNPRLKRALPLGAVVATLGTLAVALGGGESASEAGVSPQVTSTDAGPGHDGSPNGGPKAISCDGPFSVVQLLCGVALGTSSRPEASEAVADRCAFKIAVLEEALSADPIARPSEQTREPDGPAGRWLRAMLYPPLVQYRVDDLRPDERLQYRDMYDAGFLDLGEVFGTNDEQVRVSTPRGATHNVRCADGQPPSFAQEGDRWLSIAKSLNRLQTMATVEGVNVWFDDGRMRIAVPRIKNRDGAILDLVLGQIEVFREVGGQRQACGPLRFLDADPGKRLLRFALNPNGLRAPAAWSRLDGAICAQEMSPDEIHTQPYDLLLAPHDPFRGQPRAGYSSRSLASGSHVYAALNPASPGTPETRRWIYESLLLPAVRQLLQAQVLQPGPDAPASWWFPSSWAYASQVINGLPTLSGYNGVTADRGGLRTLRVHFDGLDADRGKAHTFARALFEQAERQQITLSVAEDWQHAQMVVFNSRFDAHFGNPSHLLLTGRRLAGVGLDRHVELLDEMNQSYLTNGEFETRESIREFQRRILDDATIFPLFSEPYSVHVKSACVGALSMNYQAGFVRLDEWRLEPSACGEPR